MLQKPAKHKQYEKDAALVLTQILGIEGATSVNTVCNAAVDTIVQGQKSEVDILSKFMKEGKGNQLAVECKHHNRPVSKTLYSGFRGMLADLKEPHSGMMVSPAGFQRGAKALARANSISLCVFTNAKPEFFTDSKVPTIDAHCRVIYYSADKVQFILDKLPPEVTEQVQAFCSATEETGVIFRSDEGRTFSLKDVYQEIFERFASANLKRKVSCYEFLKTTEMLVPDVGPLEVRAFKGIFSKRQIARFRVHNQIGHVFAKLDSRDVFLIDQAMSVIRAGDQLQGHGPCIDLEPYRRWRQGEDTA